MSSFSFESAGNREPLTTLGRDFFYGVKWGFSVAPFRQAQDQRQHRLGAHLLYSPELVEGRRVS